MAVKKKYFETPLMKQYYGIKEKHPDAILLFRVGDFYETFGKDAIKASKILDIVLTKRVSWYSLRSRVLSSRERASVVCVKSFVPKLMKEQCLQSMISYNEVKELSEIILRDGGVLRGGFLTVPCT